MQVDPIKPTLKAPGIKLLKLKYDEVLSSSALKFNVRRHTLVVTPLLSPEWCASGRYRRETAAVVGVTAGVEAGDEWCALCPAGTVFVGAPTAANSSDAAAAAAAAAREAIVVRR